MKPAAFRLWRPAPAVLYSLTMAIEIRVPSLGESITEVEIGQWFKAEGDAVQKDENIVALESEKATVELPAPAAGRLAKILKPKGQKANVGDVIATLEPVTKPVEKEEGKPAEKTEPVRQQPQAQAVAEAPKAAASGGAKPRPAQTQTGAPLAPIAAERRPPAQEQESAPMAAAPVVPALVSVQPSAGPAQSLAPPAGDGQEEVVPMSLLRRTVAKRLVEAAQSMAILTTFNEIDMSAVIALRKEHQEAFKAKHAIKLGFMSFFVRATIEALKAVPQLNASIRGGDIVYHNYFDIAIAIGSGKGLVAPVLRDAGRMSFAEIEKAIDSFAQRAKENKLFPEELKGGTFTITNGGVYGSLFSTPIINPPQSGILAMHAIQPRPVAQENNVVVRPMMYVALSYDHRLVDGREAVTFLSKVKEMIQSPARILLEI